MSRVDFSANARVYDDRHGALLDDDLARRLVAAAALPPGGRVLDVGAGTGRVAISLAALGCRIVALDPSASMLQQLREKGGSEQQDPPYTAPVGRVLSDPAHVSPVVGVGSALPFRDRTFDGVVLARLLYLLSDWRDTLDEAVRVLRPGGCLLHEWGNGDPDEEWVQIREQARALFERAGLANPFHPGARDESRVDQWLLDRGMTRACALRAESSMRTTMGKFLERVETGECTYTWSVPKEVQRVCLPALRAWAAGRFDLDREVPVPRDLKWTIFRKVRS
jgi:ubiquinone/menaquinone biosynthesis C-methylase UbiE